MLYTLLLLACACALRSPPASARKLDVPSIWWSPSAGLLRYAPAMVDAMVNRVGLREGKFRV